MSESSASTPEELVESWREQLDTYPQTPDAQYARAAVKLCADELESVLKNCEDPASEEAEGDE